MMDELTLLMVTDPITYSNYVKSVLTMKAEAEVTKALISATTWEYRRKLKQERYIQGQKKGADP